MPPYQLVFPIIGIICASAVLITAMQLIARFISARRLSSNAMPIEEILQRLDRIEQIVDSTSVEVERLAESNRFAVTRLAEKTGTAPR